jgi:hypothetical protein
VPHTKKSTKKATFVAKFNSIKCTPPPPKKKKKNLVRAQKIGPRPGRSHHKNGTGSSFFENKMLFFLLNVILLDDLLITE